MKNALLSAFLAPFAFDTNIIDEPMTQQKQSRLARKITKRTRGRRDRSQKIRANRRKALRKRGRK